ncbi:MAG: SMC family ATPase, partial [Synechococcaceae cyanobacterium RM1_1_27]|nr:SMC family ATPase [Synechococcaceae cyanobacterium RM1_1_27]
GRDFPQIQTQLHRISPVLTQGSALTHQVIQALEGILTDISRQTSRPQLQTQRDHLQAELQTCYQMRAQAEQLPQLQQEHGSLQTQLANLSETLENLAWHLEGEQSINRQLQEIQAQIEKLGDPRAQIQLKQQELAGRDRIERDWQALQAKMEAQNQPIQALTEQLTATETLEQTIATLQAQRQQHRQDYDHYLQTLPTASALPEHRQHLQIAQNQLATIEARGKQHQIELAKLESQHGSLADLTQLMAQTTQQLRQLGDPRYQASQLHQGLSHRGEVEAALEQVGSQLSHFQTQQEHLTLTLDQTAQIDSLVIATQQQREQHQSAYETYLQFRELADNYPDCQQRLQQIQASIQENQNQTQVLQTQRDPILASYDSLGHDALKSEAHQLDVAIAQAQTQMQALIPQIAQIEEKLTHLSTLRQELATHQVTQKERENLHRFIKFSRDAYKQAGPKITALYQSSVNIIADRLFREIMDRPNLSLTWGSDYDIWVQEDGMTARRFISLSGGEQMAAALSVRLALLKVLGELDVAFFDEPTTNMDVQRRRRLAEAITQIKTFEQLVVISHDDTFEQVTENIIRVEREEGNHVA